MRISILSENITHPEDSGSAVILTAPILQKGRRFVRASNRFHAVTNAVCLFLCGICTIFSVAVILVLLSQCIYRLR